MPARVNAARLLILLACMVPTGASGAEWLVVTEGNRLRRVDLETGREDVWIERSSHAEEGRDVNGMICRVPDGTGRFVLGEDTGQPEIAPGWGIFSHAGVQVGKLSATYRAELGDPYGCVFDDDERLFTTEIGNAGFGAALGQLLLWFPPLEGENAGGFCKLASDLSTASGVAIDAKGRIYVAASSGFTIWRFTPPFPESADAAGGCGAIDELGSPVADPVQREPFFRGVYTFSGLAFGPNGNLFAASVFTGEILEIDGYGELVRPILEPDGWLPPFETGNPMGIAFDAEGSLYYADLDLRWDLPRIGPGPDGKVRRIRFDASGGPHPPETLLEGLAFPDGVAVWSETFR